MKNREIDTIEKLISPAYALGDLLTGIEGVLHDILANKKPNIDKINKSLSSIQTAKAQLVNYKNSCDAYLEELRKSATD